MRIFAYCASNVGMGHFGQLSRVIARVRELIPGCAVLLASDLRSDVLASTDNLAVLRLPGFRFVDGESFREEPEFLPVPNKSLQRLRTDVLLAAATSFRPHIALLDTHPHGKRDEMLPVLRYLKAGKGNAQVILIMQDIPCPPGETFKLNRSVRETRKHAAYYDRILISGDRRFFDAGACYGWPPDVEARAGYPGFIVPGVGAMGRDQAFAAFPTLDPAKKTIVVGFGGGWEVGAVAAQLIAGLREYRARPNARDVQVALFTGAAVEEAEFQRLRTLADQAGGAHVEKFSAAFPQLLSHCDLAVLQAGSTPFQILDTSVPILLYFRAYKSREQEVRARLLERYEGIRVIERDELAKGNWANAIAWGLESDHAPRHTGLSFDGVEQAAREVLRAAARVHRRG